MIITYKKNHGIKICKAYLCDRNEWETIKDADVIHVSYSKWSPVDQDKSKVNHTFSATNDLLLDIDVIRQGYTKTVRNEISRAGREHVEIMQFTSDDINKNREIIEECIKSYHVFCQQDKYNSIDSFIDANELNALCECGALYITIAVYDNGKTYHLYCCDGKTTMLLFSFNIADNNEMIDRNNIGRANKFLHHSDIIMFKSIGIQTYDWGGIFDPENPNGIDKFKLSFGSIPRDAYDFYYGVSVIGKIAMKGLKIKNGTK